MGSGDSFITGWILDLFPYLDGGHKNGYVFQDSSRKISKNDFYGVTTSSFDYHMNQVPFVWNYHDTEIEMLFVGGLVGVVSDKDKCLQPVFGYSIMEDKAVTDNRDDFFKR